MNRTTLEAIVSEHPDLTSRDALVLLAIIDERVAGLRADEAKNREMGEGAHVSTQQHSLQLAAKLGAQAEALESVRRQFDAHKAVDRLDLNGEESA